ncbi:MAG: NAD(P) transhydrogenase subunit alpha [Pseudomonadota bacterium]
MSDNKIEDTNNLSSTAADLATQLKQLSDQAAEVAVQASAAMNGHEASFFLSGLTVFVLACFVGYYVVWRVTPALHSPLMGVTNAISSVIIVGAVLAAGTETFGFSKFMGFLAVVLASINIFGGFIVTKRMLHMFSKKKA